MFPEKKQGERWRRELKKISLENPLALKLCSSPHIFSVYLDD